MEKQLTATEVSIIYNALCDRSRDLQNAVNHVSGLMRNAPSTILLEKENALRQELREQKEIVDELSELFCASKVYVEEVEYE